MTNILKLLGAAMLSLVAVSAYAAATSSGNVAGGTEVDSIGTHTASAGGNPGASMGFGAALNAAFGGNNNNGNANQNNQNNPNDKGHDNQGGNH